MASKNTFRTLPISTQTVMAYMNCSFDIANIVKYLPAEQVEVGLKKLTNGVHGKIYAGPASKKTSFRNQKQVSIYIIDKIITVKIFPTGKFHLTGCKNAEHQKWAVFELLNHIRRINTPEHPTIVMEDEEPLNAILEVVMVNVDFHLDFDVDQRKLDQLLQGEQVTDFYTIYETPVNTSVNIKLDYPDPIDKKYNQVIIAGTVDKPEMVATTVADCPKARSHSTRTHTFLVFSSSKVIQSGRYYDSEMEPAYKKFRDFIMNNRNKIELELEEKHFDMTNLKGLNTPLKIKLPKKT